MRKFLALAALVLGLASCQQDVDTVAPVGGEVDFQLKVAAPELVGTRAGENGAADTQNAMDSAFGAIDYLQGAATGDYRQDWGDVDLRYTLEVYDKATNYADAVPVKDRQVIIVDEYKPVVFDLRLVPNRDYHFVVFADFVAQDEYKKDATAQLSVVGIRHEIGATLADITLKNEAINDEVADSYFATRDIKVTNSAAQDIVLKRPYGKVRVVATDLAELNLNVHPKSVVVEYESFNPNKFNAVTGDIDGKYTIKQFTTTFVDNVRDDMDSHYYNVGYDAETAPAVNGTVRNTHITLFTDYILAEDDQTPIHFTMTVNDGKGGEIKTTAFTTDIPVERNKLTTVIGNVLTTATEIEVRIDDNFAGENVKNMVFVNTVKEFQEALDNYVNGQTIILDADIKGNVTVDQVEGKDYVIDGNGYNYDGTIYIDGNSRNDGTETIIIRNFNFATDSSDINFIEQNSADGAVRYAHNVTIENCSFRATGVNVVAVKIRQGYNITIKNCVADGVTRANDSGMHSLGQFYGCTGITIDGVNFNNAGEGGVSFGTSTNVVVKNSTFVTGYYGVRADASVETTLKLENVNITAMIPVIARQCTADYAIELTGENTMEAIGYDIVFTQGGDKAAFVAPTSNFSVTGADEFVVFPSDKMPLYAYNVAGLQYLLDNAVNGDTIELVADIEGDVTVSQKADVKIAIEGNDQTYAGVITVDGKSKTYTTAGVTIKNLNFEADTISADACIRLGDGTNATRYACNVAVEGCTFNVPGAVAVKSYTGGDKNLTIKRCTATGLHSLLQVKNIEGVTIEEVTVDAGRGASFGVSSNIVVKNSTFVAESYGLRADGSAEATLAIEGGKIEAYIPVSVRNMTADDYNAKVMLDGTETVKGGLYDVAICSNEYEEGVNAVQPKGTCKVISTGTTYIVFPTGESTLKAVAKVGGVEYGSFDEAIANWTNGSTLTLLDNVTLSDVVTIKSTEHHILNLGTYTLTAAEGKNAFEITACGTGASERYAITISADATNPGSINAGSKAIVYYDYSKGTAAGADDRPIIKINGGVFNASTAAWGTAGIYFKGGSKARQAATLNISGGEFYCSINGQSKSKMIITGGLFHYSVGSQGDSTATRLISGGTFKTLGFMTADSNNTKFWFGTSMGNSNVGLYINDDNYLVVGGPVITEFGDKFKAKATNATKWSSYLQYSSAATNGLYYTNAEMAIKKHGEANVVLP